MDTGGRVFAIKRQVTIADLDHYGHVNNAVYLAWLDDCAWRHADSLGLGIEFCQKVDQGFVVTRAEIDYLASLRQGDWAEVCTWISASDNRSRGERGFVVCDTEGKCVLRATLRYAAISLSTLKPCRMNPLYVEAIQKFLAEQPVGRMP